jgi:ABC-type phosphate/phosphonate transport system permease subunit
MRGEALEDSSRRHPIAVGDALERPRYGCFNCALSGCIHSSAALRETQHRASSIGGILGAGQ